MSPDDFRKFGEDYDPLPANMPTRDTQKSPEDGMEQAILENSLVPDGAGQSSSISNSLRGFLTDMKTEAVNSDKEKLDSILEEFHGSKQTLLESYLNVMMGGVTSVDYLRGGYSAKKKRATTRNPALRRVFDEIVTLDEAIKDTENFIRPRLPEFYTGDEMMTLPSFSAAGIKYLVSRTDPDAICFGVEIPLDEFSEVMIDMNTGRLRYNNSLKHMHVRPFFHTPLDKLLEEYDRNSETFHDTHSRGHHLPTFVKLYTEFVTFAIQENPAVIAAAFLAKDKPDESGMLLEEQNKVLAVINSHVLTQLGYVTTDGRGMLDTLMGDDDERQSFTRPSFMQFQTLKNWRDHFCKRLFPVEFAASFLNIRINKTVDMVDYMVSRNSAQPEATVTSF